MANFNQEGLVSHAFPSAYTTTQPGTKINGVIVYDVPQGVKLVTMTYDDQSANPGSYSHVVINLAGSLNAATSATSSTSATPSTPTSTPSVPLRQPVIDSITNRDAHANSDRHANSDAVPHTDAVPTATPIIIRRG